MNKTELLNKVAQTADERQLLARVWDKAEQAQRGVPAWTPFLSQSQQEAANRLIAAAGYPRHLWTGGFDDAERKLCAFFPDWQEEEAFEPPLTALRCRWQSGEKLSHRDFLGAILGQGVDREKVGDLLVGQGVVNMLMIAGFFPVVGVPLPFISYGGTSLVVTLMAVGMLSNISLYSEKKEKENRKPGGRPSFRQMYGKKARREG